MRVPRELFQKYPWQGLGQSPNVQMDERNYIMNDGRYPVEEKVEEEAIPVKRRKFPDDHKRLIFWGIIAVVALCIIGGAVAGLKYILREEPDIEVSGDSGWKTPDYVDVQLIAKNEYSRPGKKLDEVNGIVVHYVANPGTSAEANRSYFAGLAQSKATYASSNFIIGLEGEVIQCVPADEVAYASNNRNSDTLSIECCHPDETGVFTYPTYRSLVKLCADICIGFELDPETDIIRHYDITGKMCPLYFVENENEWKAFLSDVKDAVDAEKTAETSQK